MSPRFGLRMSNLISCPHCMTGKVVLNRFRNNDQVWYEGVCPLCDQKTSIMLSKPGSDPDSWEYPWDQEGD
jgi:hypothetical protein